MLKHRKKLSQINASSESLQDLPQYPHTFGWNLMVAPFQNGGQGKDDRQQLSTLENEVVYLSDYICI